MTIIDTFVRTVDSMVSTNTTNEVEDILTNLVIPVISFASYVDRFNIYLRKEDKQPVIFLTAFIYMDRWSSIGHLNIYTVHRVFLVCFVLALKYLIDDPPSNLYMARIGGVSLMLLNSMERFFLNAIQFNLFVTNEEYAELVYEFR